MMRSMLNWLQGKRVVVCCGAGGVGKTTVSASLALSAARAGLRVVAITVDPSRRLAEALGVARNLPAPTELTRDRLRAVGVEPPGALAAWMLDPQLVCDRVVHAVSPSDGARRQLLGNRLYQNVSALIAGMHEYTAVEALHQFIRDDRYDLVVLDTPPSRNALRFLDAPARANAFLDPRILGLFLPSGGGAFQRAGARLLNKLLDLGLGQAAREELQEFLGLFQVVLRHLDRNQDEMRRFFASPQVSFLLVTSPQQAALDEAQHFEARARTLGVGIGGYVLNQTLAHVEQLPPPQALVSVDARAAREALKHLAELAALDQRTARGHTALAEALRARAGGKPVWALPRLLQSDVDLAALTTLSDLLVGPPAVAVTAPALAAAVP